LRQELQSAYQTYFAVEEKYLEVEKAKAEKERADAEERYKAATAELALFEEKTTTDVEGVKRTEAVRHAERELDRVTNERAKLSRDIGRVEGSLDAAKKRVHQVARDPYVKVSREDLAALKDEVEKQRNLPDSAPAEAIRAALHSVHHAISVFFQRFASPNDDYIAEEEQAAYGFEKERDELLLKDEQLSSALEQARNALLRAREAVFAYEETSREERHRVLQLAEVKAKEEGNVARLKARIEGLQFQAEAFDRERGEALALAGTPALSYTAVTQLPEEERRVQEDRLRVIERLKIRVEEAGGAGEDVRSEYKDAVDREAYLGSELEDLSKSAAGLRSLIEELDTELSKTFSEGLAKVNASFGEFFALMFGGGSARLVLEEAPEPDEDELDDADTRGAAARTKPGIEISVNLPKKRVQALMQLSGGERALTSIALIFAMSQVNPPPFLILDETDAALDEANSRRYGDMIDNLAKKSQLIVITHNRETMSRAGILYGVTMGADGISKLLSVKFEEAVTVAK
jgi:chromosome segregation protein